jgi:hypothetical protein
MPITLFAKREMNPQFAVYLFRLLRGERIEKTQAWDYRYWFGVLFLTPLAIALASRGGEAFWNKSTVILWIGITVFGVVWLCLSLLWARFVPAVASLVLSIPAWIACYLLMPFK